MKQRGDESEKEGERSSDINIFNERRHTKRKENELVNPHDDKLLNNGTSTWNISRKKEKEGT